MPRFISIWQTVIDWPIRPASSAVTMKTPRQRPKSSHVRLPPRLRLRPEGVLLSWMRTGRDHSRSNRREMSKGLVFNHDLRVERGARFSLRSPGQSPSRLRSPPSDLIAAWPLITTSSTDAAHFQTPHSMP
jgi:hypothetical protein